MKEFIEELKYNQNINMEKGLENRIDIDYVIERLESINICDEFLKGEINFNIETLMNDEFVEQEQKDRLLELKDEDIEEIVDELNNDDCIWQEITESVQYFVNKHSIEE